MTHGTSARRWAWGLVGASVLAVLAFLPTVGLTNNSTPIWSDRPVVSPAAGGVTEPNWVELARALKPAVVNVTSTRAADRSAPGALAPGDDPMAEFFNQHFGRRLERPTQARGSGFVINADGYIVTNNHVVDGATEVRVKLSEGRELTAKVVGRDPKIDVALIKVDATGLPVIPLGDSTAMQVGEPVMAIGNPFGLEQTVTTGIVSGTGRVIGEGPYDDFIQTDASINPGNSGGPLINASGRAIGINTAILSRSGGSIGIGFAIPINLAKPALTQLAQTGHVVRGWLGVEIQPVTDDLAKSFGLPSATGALVANVQDGSPANKAGLKPGDVITEFNGRKVARAEELSRVVAETPSGQTVPVTVMRDGKPLRISATIGTLDDTDTRQASAPSPAAPGALGLSLQSVTPAVARELDLKEQSGAIVRDVRSGGPADKAGMQQGDVITEIDRHRVANADEAKQAIERHAKGSPVLLLVHRDGSSRYVAITTG